MIGFEIIQKIGRARRGRILTLHGSVETPAYLPCGTHGTVKTVSPSELANLGLELILSNTYHLYLRPGIDKIEQLGGLHKFMGWQRAIFTDSGGFQAFSLGQGRGLTLAKTTEEGIAFRSHLDGSRHFFSPEDVVRYQEQLGVDIATCLDVCTGFPESEKKVGWAVELTNAWAERSIKARSQKPEDRSQIYFLYGMVQGSIYPELRRRSAEFLRELPFDGFAIGGNMYTFGAPLAELVAEKPKMWEILDLLDDLLPADKPRHLLGVGEPADIIEGVRHGIDTFDCVMPTRMARNGAIWLWTESENQNDHLKIKKTEVILGGEQRYYQRVNFTNAQFAIDSSPLAINCACPACTSGLARAWFHHAFRMGEQLAARLATLHNLAFLQGILESLRAEIHS